MQTYDSLRKYYINLESRYDRREAMEKQIGNDFERVSAFYGKEHTDEEIELLFDSAKAAQRYQIKDLTVGQKSCTISHFELYKKIVADKSISESDWVLISEDDNLFTPDFKHKITQLLDFLAQEKFSLAELVQLRIYDFSIFIDFTDELFNFSAYRQYEESVPLHKREYIKPLLLNDFIIANNPKTQKFSFVYNYQDGNVDKGDRVYYSNSQHLISPTDTAPWSSALYLVRKSTLQRTINTFPKPYWVTDDFREFVSPQFILIASPNFAIENKSVGYSDIQDDKAISNAQSALINNEYTLRRRDILGKFNVIYKFIYNSSPFMRQIGLWLLKLLKVRRGS